MRWRAIPRSPSILAQLLGPAIRQHGGKLNMKSAGYGSPVEWHQDWAFYPHTNDDVLATGIYLDDCDMDNGPLMVIPGSHHGPTYDHHADGRFCGAMNPEACDIDFAKAVPLMGPAGSMTIHHVRLVHGSALNRSNRQRRLLLHEYTAADAWPLLGVADFEEFNGRMVLGEPTIEPRVVAAPIRMPLPPADHQGSIYENQRGAGPPLLRDLRGASRAGVKAQVISSPSRNPRRGGAREAGGGVMGNSIDAHDPSVGVRRRHLPSEAGEEGLR